MTIPASQLVDITSRVVGGGLSGLEFAGTILTKNTLLPTATAVPFYSQSAVGEYFGTGSTEYKLAGNYFQADSNSSRKPKTLWFYRFVDTAAAAFLRGTEPAKLDALQDITNGSFVIKVDGTTITCSSLDFSSQTSYSGVASVVQTALQTGLASTTCTWDSLRKAFVVTSPTTGDTSTIEFATASPSEGIVTNGKYKVVSSAYTPQAYTEIYTNVSHEEKTSIFNTNLTVIMQQGSKTIICT